MRFANLAIAAAAVSTASAQRPKDTPICDYYTTALLKDNTAKNQATLLTLLVNTVVIGNYTKPNVGVAVPGILAPGDVSGTKVNLLPYFSGGLDSTNRGGNKGVSVNFLDGGAAEPLKKNMPANDKTSNQYFLLTHLYEFFGSLLGCTQQGMAGFDAYSGHASMYEVHKFMDLNEAEVTYFITQVGTAAASFGVAKDDITAVGTALNTLFGMRCAPATTAIKAQGPQLQAICIDSTCPIADGAVCNKYAKAMEPMTASMKSNSSSTKTMASGSGTMMATGTMTGSMTGTMTGSSTASPSSANSAAGVTNGLGFAAMVAGFAAFVL